MVLASIETAARAVGADSVRVWVTGHKEPFFNSCGYFESVCPCDAFDPTSAVGMTDATLMRKCMHTDAKFGVLDSSAFVHCDTALLPLYKANRRRKPWLNPGIDTALRADWDTYDNVIAFRWTEISYRSYFGAPVILPQQVPASKFFRLVPCHLVNVSCRNNGPAAEVNCKNLKVFISTEVGE